MDNSQPDDNCTPEGMGGVGPLEIIYADHTMAPLFLVFDTEEKLTESGPIRLMVEYGPNGPGRIYVSPNYDEPIHDSNRPDDATEGRSPKGITEPEY